MQCMPAWSRVSAAATLAAIMNSSISRCASRRGRVTIACGRPSGPSRTSASGRSRSRVPRPARLGQNRIGAVQRADHALEQRRRDLVGRAVGRRLHPLVGEPGARAHQRALEAVPELAPAPVDPQVHREAGAVLARAQRAQAVGQRLRQHRQHPVGEVDRVGAPPGFQVQRIAGAHVVGDVRDRHDQMPAAGIGRVGIGLGVHRIVEVARVRAVDRDQRQRAQVDALAQRHRRAAAASASASGGKAIGRPTLCAAKRRSRPGRVLRRPNRSITFARPRPSAAPAMRSATSEVARVGAHASCSRTSSSQRPPSPVGSRSRPRGPRCNRPTRRRGSCRSRRMISAVASSPCQDRRASTRSPTPGAAARAPPRQGAGSAAACPRARRRGARAARHRHRARRSRARRRSAARRTGAGAAAPAVLLRGRAASA